MTDQDFQAYVDSLLHMCAKQGDPKAIEILARRSSEPHPVSSEMQPHEEKPDLTVRPYLVEGSGQPVKDPPACKR